MEERGNSTFCIEEMRDYRRIGTKVKRLWHLSFPASGTAAPGQAVFPGAYLTVNI